MRMRGAWQVVGSWLFICVYGTAASVVTVATLGLGWRELSPWLMRVWGRAMLKLAGVTYSVEGAEHLHAEGMKIVAFNHASLIDAFLVTAIMPARSTAAVKRELLYYPVIGPAVWLLGLLLIDRRTGGKAHEVMNRAARRMKENDLCVFIAPEGTRRRDPELLPFKKGALRLALSSGASIVPMLIDGAYELHGPGKLVSTPGHVVIRFLAPRSPAGLTAETVGLEADALRETFRLGLARLRADRVARGDGAQANPAREGQRRSA
jgi:1-acyl-sn-glycerol-3-phosphate acyltransferase